MVGLPGIQKKMTSELSRDAREWRWLMDALERRSSCTTS